LEAPGCRLSSRARHGLYRALPAVGLQRGDEVLVPAYHHGSEVEALLRAGVAPRFYEMGEDLRPDPDELDARRGASTRALYLIHYLGFPSDGRWWRQWCDERGLLLIEDAAQAWLASNGPDPVGSSGDVALFCLYKTFGIPDGAAVVATGDARATGRSRVGLSPLARRHGRWLASRSAVVASLSDRLRRPRPHVIEDDVALGDVDSAPALTSRALIRRVVDPGAAAARRANHLALAERLGHLVPPALRFPAEGAAPHAFPVLSPDPPALVRSLAAAGIRAFPFWSSPHPSLPAREFPGAAAWRARLVVLPVHQELSAAALHRIADAASGQAPASR
jgi:dTDP-4-amino-4,6-dideoxygalactose transaminase